MGISPSVERIVHKPRFLESPADTAGLRTPNPLRVVSYHERSESWTLAIASMACEHANHLSLGGFRIAPDQRRLSAGFSAEREAADLAIGMEEKVFWSRHLGLAGPLGKGQLARIFGGKCVLDPGARHRVGECGDSLLLEFACEAFIDFERETGISLITGQDLGHGLMTNGETSLAFLHRHFLGCVGADTSGPTAYGNLGVIDGFRAALQIPYSSLRVGLLGCGNIGRHLASALLKRGAQVLALDASELSQKWCAGHDIECLSANEKARFLEREFDILCVNAAGRSLDGESVATIVQNPHIRAVTGCENLVFTEDSLESTFQSAQVLFSPTEYCGMFGYLTAVESYLNPNLNIVQMQNAALGISSSAQQAADIVLKSAGSKSLREALVSLGFSCSLSGVTSAGIVIGGATLQ